VVAKESAWSDENSLSSLDVDDVKPPLSMQPLHPMMCPSPMASSAKASSQSATSANVSQKKRKKKKKKKSKEDIQPRVKKHKKTKSKKGSSTVNIGPSTSKKHRKSVSISKRKIFPIAVEDGELIVPQPSAPVTTTTTSNNAMVGRMTIGTNLAGSQTNVMSMDDSGDETENAIVMAVREIRRYRERIAELEEHVRQLSESYGIDPESLLMPESMGASAGSSTVLRKGARGIRVSVEGTHPTTSSSRQDLASEFTDDSQQLTTPSMLSPSFRPELPGPPNGVGRQQNPMISDDQKPLSEEQKMNNIMTKLQKLTGRKMSLEEISPLLRARTADEAMRNGRMLRNAEHMKRVYGGRPGNYVCVKSNSPTPGSPQAPVPTAAPAAPAAAAAPASTTTATTAQEPAPKSEPAPAAPAAPSPEKNSPQHSHGHQHLHQHREARSKGDGEEVFSRKEKAHLRKKKSHSVFDFTSLMPIDGEDDDDMPPPEVPLPESASTEVVNDPTVGIKIEKLSRLTGRRGSLSEIRGLLLPTTAEEAKKCAQSLYTVEKLKKRYGERPAMDQSPQPPEA